MKGVQPPTHMTLRLQKDIERFRELVPVLKYCRGEHLSTDHWLEVEYDLTKCLNEKYYSSSAHLVFRAA